MRAPLAGDVHHAITGMLLAVCPPLASLHIEGRPLRAAVMGALYAHDVDHAVSSMLFAVRSRMAAHDIKVWLFRA